MSRFNSITNPNFLISNSVSRILSIAIVASLFPRWYVCQKRISSNKIQNKNCFFLCRTLLYFSIHAIVMGLWVFIFDRSPFCSNTWIHSLLFSLILGFVFIFNYILPKARQTRYRYAIFYTICFIENIICVGLYVTYSREEDKQEDYFLILCLMSILPFIVGIFFMILYYLWFHPNLVSRRIYRDQERAKEMQTISQSVDPVSVSTA